ncbi:MAG: hypothetical protein KAU28_07270 [Phycisphaerae bacterium]|nr:hypothetical protein [Phycisphaerae bacterium]
MRISTIISALFVAAMLAGCAAEVGPPTFTAESRGLAVTIELPKRDFLVGEQFTVTLTARNKTSQPIRIEARNSSPYILRLWRHTGTAWDQAKEYPEVALAVMSPWTLRGGARRTFIARLTVEPDWPTGELLRLSGELNGRPDAAPGVAVSVRRAPESSK